MWIIVLMGVFILICVKCSCNHGDLKVLSKSGLCERCKKRKNRVSYVASSGCVSLDSFGEVREE